MERRGQVAKWIRNKNGKLERTDETMCLTCMMPAWDVDHAPCRIVFKRLRTVREQARGTK